MKARGRPPSREAMQKALHSARDILIEDGFGRLTVEAVSLRSGVGKPTIYRNWSNASELAMAALMVDAENDLPSENRHLSSTLRAQLRTIVAAFATTRGRQIALALAASDPESEMTKAFRNRVILSSRENGRRLAMTAYERSEIELPDNIEVLLDMIYAPVFYRLLVGHLPLDLAFADQISEEAMKLFRNRAER